MLKDDMNNYRKAWEKMRVAEKINNERALEHRLLWEKLKKISPNPSVWKFGRRASGEGP